MGCPAAAVSLPGALALCCDLNAPCCCGLACVGSDALGHRSHCLKAVGIQAEALEVKAQCISDGNSAADAVRQLQTGSASSHHLRIKGVYLNSHRDYKSD